MKKSNRCVRIERLFNPFLSLEGTKGAFRSSKRCPGAIVPDNEQGYGYNNRQEAERPSGGLARNLRINIHYSKRDSFFGY